MDIQVFDVIVSEYKNKIDFSKYPDTEEGLQKFNKDFALMKKDISNKIKIVFKGVQNPKEVAKELIDYKNKNGIDPEVIISEDFGKYNVERGKEKKSAETAIEKICEDLIYRNCIMQIKTPKVYGRVECTVFKSLAPSDPKEFYDFCEVMQKNNDEIDPITGRPYGETKAKLIADGFDKIEIIAKEYSKSKNSKELATYVGKYYAQINGLCEFDGGKIYQSLKCIGLTNDEVEKKYPFLAEKINKAIKFQNSYVGLSLCRSHIGIMSNPLYQYTPNNDEMAYMGCIGAENDLNTDNREKLTNIGISPLADPIQGIYQVMQLYDYPKLLQAGKIYKQMMTERFKDVLNIFILPTLNVKAEDLCFFVDNIEQKIDANDNEQLQQINQMILDGKTITLKDKTGKFLIDYKSSREQMLNIQGGGNGLNIVSAVNDGFINSTKDIKIKLGKTDDLGANIEHMKQEIKTASENVSKKIDESVQTEIDNKLGKMLKSLQACNPSKLRNEDTSYYNDIEEMLKDVLGKKDKNNKSITFNKDKDAYIQSLKSIRTFCQAYLDENNGREMDKISKAKYDAINGVYIDLLDVENQLSYVKEFEKDLNNKLVLKARRDNPEFVKNVDSKVINKPIVESEKVIQEPKPSEERTQLFNKQDIDPTTKQYEIKKSGQVTNEKKNDLNKDDIVKQ